MPDLTPAGSPAGSLATPVAASWWRRNRLALFLLLPLAVLACLASSYPLLVLYLPNTFSRAQRSHAGSTVHFREAFVDTGFNRPERQFTREVTITVKGIRQASEFQGERAPRAAHLWITTLEFQASPNQLLDGCHVMLVDTRGWLYDQNVGKLGFPQQGMGCLPKGSPGPAIDFSGLILTEGNPRPPTWTVERAIALPEGAVPRAVRVAWQPPAYAELRLPGTGP